MNNTILEKYKPENKGIKWTEEEEKILLEELNNNDDIELISTKHKRTIGGINARRKQIAYSMHIENIPMCEIINKTKLNEEQILDIINKNNNSKQNINKKKISTENEIIEIKKKICIEDEIVEIKKEIIEFKNIINNFVKIIKKLE